MYSANIWTSPVKSDVYTTGKISMCLAKKNHFPSQAHDHTILCALGQNLPDPGMWAHLNVEPWAQLIFFKIFTKDTPWLTRYGEVWVVFGGFSPVFALSAGPRAMTVKNLFGPASGFL